MAIGRSRISVSGSDRGMWVCVRRMVVVMRDVVVEKTL